MAMQSNRICRDYDQFECNAALNPLEPANLIKLLAIQGFRVSSGRLKIKISTLCVALFRSKIRKCSRLT